MDEEYARRLLYKAVTAIKSGENKSARDYLERLFLASRDYDQLADGWFYMSRIAEDPVEKRKALEEALSYRMTHARARRALAVIDGKISAAEIVDANAIPAPLMDDSEANAERFMCPNCGARMSFAPDGQTLTCDFCAVGEEIASAGEATEEQDFFSAMATRRGHSKPVARQVFHCDGCGAEFLLPPDQISTSCAYCASPHVISLNETRELLDPDAIIPHAFNQHQAIKFLIGWVQAHDFTPQGKVLPPRGFYLPVWTFDFAGYISYKGQRYQKEQQGFQEKVVVIAESGEYPVYIDDLVIAANHAYQKQILELLPTYNLREGKVYDARYLANWAAEAYEIALSDASLEARSRAYKDYKKKIQRDMRNLANLSTSSANLAIDSYKLLMLPVWITTYPFDEQEYHILINGQTGDVQGELPQQVAAAKAKKNKSNGGVLGWLDALL